MDPCGMGFQEYSFSTLSQLLARERRQLSKQICTASCGNRVHTADSYLDDFNVRLQSTDSKWTPPTCREGVGSQ